MRFFVETRDWVVSAPSREFPSVGPQTSTSDLCLYAASFFHRQFGLYLWRVSDWIRHGFVQEKQGRIKWGYPAEQWHNQHQQLERFAGEQCLPQPSGRLFGVGRKSWQREQVRVRFLLHVKSAAVVATPGTGFCSFCPELFSVDSFRQMAVP